MCMCAPLCTTLCYVYVLLVCTDILQNAQHFRDKWPYIDSIQLELDCGGIKMVERFGYFWQYLLMSVRFSVAVVAVDMFFIYSMVP